ncbi:MAG: hypothetical protein J6C42_13140 [Clostridia bacterium]|nr:hypothetical protein [Clostridia bacterium]
MNNDLLTNLQTCHSFLTKLEEKIEYISVNKKYVYGWESMIHGIQTKLSLKGQIILSLKILIITVFSMFISGALLAEIYPTFNTTSAVKITIFLSVIVSIIIIVIDDLLSNRKIHILKGRINSSQERIQTEISEIKDFLNTPEGLLVQSLIPPDYRKADIVEKFIYFFRNGHVDTMKEAVHEYDNYRHTTAMEVAAEQSAIAAARTALQAAQTAKNAEEIKLWTMLNTYINFSK